MSSVILLDAALADALTAISAFRKTSQSALPDTLAQTAQELYAGGDLEGLRELPIIAARCAENARLVADACLYPGMGQEVPPLPADVAAIPCVMGSGASAPEEG